MSETRNFIPIFVYGSLKTGFGNNGILRNGMANRVGLATTVDDYFMFSLGGYPGVIDSGFSPDKGKPIFGELWMVNEKTLRALDLLESNGSLYERKLTDIHYYDSTKNEFAADRAWMYFYLHDLEDAIENDARGRIGHTVAADSIYEWVKN